MLVVFTFATAVVVGLIISLATNNWLLLPVALLVHALGSAFVMLVIVKRLQEEDKPDPVTEAHLDNGEDVPQDGLTNSGRAKDREIII